MKTHTTAIINLKGGVAKTTTAINLAAILAKANARVLLLDADSQCNCTEFFDANSSLGNLADILRKRGDTTDFKKFIQKTAYSHLDVIPGDDSLMDLDLSKVELGKCNVNILRILVEEVKPDYDFILIDCPPAFNAASAAALVAADDVIIPIKLDAFSLRGMTNLMHQIRNMRRINPRLDISGVLPTMWYKSPEIMDAENELHRAGLPVYPHIRRSDKVDKMTFQQDPLLICSPNSAAGVDYRKFTSAYIRRCQG